MSKKKVTAGFIALMCIISVIGCSSGGGGGAGIVPTPEPAGSNFTGETEPWTGSGDPFADDSSKLVNITSPFTVTQASYTLTGTVASGVSGLTLAQGEQTPAEVSLSGGSFSVPLTLIPGANILHLAASDSAGTRPRYNPVIIYDTSGQPGGASSDALIADAEAAGTITAEQSLSYRIFAAFGDARLPAEYRGDDSLAMYDNILSELTATLPNLSEAAKDTLGPFLAPDIYSPAPAVSPSPAGRIARASAVLCNPLRSTDCAVSNTWLSVAGDNVRVWYDAMRGGDRDKAEAVKKALDGTGGAWGKLQSIMHVVPIPDQGRAFFYGEDDKLDIILANIANPGITTSSVTDSNNGVPVFIRLKRSLSTDMLVGAGIHELMHAFQYAITLANGAGPTAYHTLSEGTADWAIWYVAPKNPFEHLHNYAYFKEPNRGLFSVNDRNTDRFPYATWMFFMYLSKKTGSDIIGDIWSQAKSKTDQLEILKAAVTGKGKELDETWHDWAISFWNGGPNQGEERNDLADWAAIKDYPVPTTNEQALPQPLDTEYLMRTEDLPALAMEYHRFTFPTEEARSLLLLDGWTNILGKESPLMTLDGRPLQAYAVYPPTSTDQVKGARMQVTSESNEAWKTVNFTDELVPGGAANLWHYQTFCRDLTQQRLTTMVVTLSYADVSATGKIYNRPGQLPRLIVSNIFCGKIRGTGNFTKTWDGVTQQISMSQFDYQGQDYGTFSKAQPGGFVIYGRQFMLTSGTVNWTMTGTTSGGCVFNEKLSGPVAGTDFLVSYTYSTDLAKRAYQFGGLGFNSGQGTAITPACPNQPTWPTPWFPFMEFGLKQFGFPAPTNLDTAYFDADGTILQGDATMMLPSPGTTFTGTWTIRNMPE